MTTLKIYSLFCGLIILLINDRVSSCPSILDTRTHGLGSKTSSSPGPNSGAQRTGSSTSGTPLSPLYQGIGTTWGGNWQGGKLFRNCDFVSWPQPAGLPEVAIPGNLWNNASLCGACVEVTGPTGLKKLAVAGDSCFSCSAYGLDLDPLMWGAVTGNASPSALPITWQVVPCGFNGSMKIINKDGVSGYFLSMQVAGANQPVKSLEISTDGGTNWLPTDRQTSDNYFQVANQPKDTSTVDVRITCADGTQVVSKNVDYTRPGVTASPPNC
ncbi:hypothetical protein CROQUDRAFT_715789 [Cronartium quercuum f. sp. fusiforme G11]|uniref:Expansin-like EG45 domain-containing protein n=1 Tax=Cronartium quercuum f. sp. fusiforme G11 TaxID=708437 RepID=A0A9P6NHH8_9BASI|nr:hypothetical protein CROQUDRAFT_715789 [Cronartium quercuum f. sp. fusiforme G11]